MQWHAAAAGLRLHLRGLHGLHGLHQLGMALAVHLASAAVLCS